MSLAHLTPTQLRLLQLVCFVVPIAAALLLSRIARKKRKYVSFRIVDADGKSIVGVVSTVVGQGPRQKIRAIGRLDENGTFRRIFTPFEPRTLLITADGITDGIIPIGDVATPDAFAEKPSTLTVRNGDLLMRENDGRA